MKFKYEGFNNMGQARKGEVEAPSEGKAVELLREDGIFAQKIVGEGEVLETVLPGNDEAPKEAMVMPWQDPAPAESKIIDPAPPKAKLPAIVPGFPAKPAETKTIIVPGCKWKSNLKNNLDAIDEVVMHFEKLRPKSKKATELDKRITAAKNAAVDELVSQAIKKAVAEAL